MSSKDSDLAEQFLETLRKNPESLKKLMQSIEMNLQQSGHARGIASYAERLQQAALSYQKEAGLNVGDLVTWKPDLKNRTRPDYNEPAVVMEILSTPLVNESTDPGSPYFKEPLTMIIGILGKENELLTFYVDGRRFDLCEII